MGERIYSSKKEAVENIKNLCTKDKKWELIPCDDPKRGLYGILASYTTDKKDEKGFPVEVGDIFYWPIVGDKALEPQEERVSGQELLNFAQEALEKDDLYPCDNPRQLVMGFVRYLPEEGISKIKTITVRMLKSENAEIRDKIIKIRDSLMEENKWQQRVAEIEGFIN